MKRLENVAAVLLLSVVGLAAEGCSEGGAPAPPGQTIDPSPAAPAPGASGGVAPPTTLLPSHLAPLPTGGQAPLTMVMAGGISVPAPAPTPPSPEPVPAPAPVPGVTRWGHQAGAGGANAGSSIVTDARGDSYVTGYFAGAIDFGCGAVAATGEYDMFLVKYAAAGGCLWARRAGGSGFTSGVDVALDGAGGVYVTGSFAGQISIGSQTLVSAAWLDGFVARFGEDGDFVWANRFGGTADDVPSSLAVHGGNVTVAGAFYGRSNFGGADMVSTGDADAFVASYSIATGEYVWAERFGGPGWDVANTLAFDPSGHITLGGHFEQSVDFGATTLRSNGLTDAFLATLDASGTPVEARGFGGLGDDEVTRLAPDGAAGTFVVGTFQRSADLGGGPLTGVGELTGFAARFAADGAHAWSTSIDASTRAFATGLAVTASGDLLVTGSFLGSSTLGSSSAPNNSVAMVVKYTAGGALSWSRTLGNEGNAEGKGIAVSGSQITLTGDFDTALDASLLMTPSAGSTNVFVVALSN